MRNTKPRISGIGLAAALGAGLAAALLALMPALKSPDGLTTSLGDMPAASALAWAMAFVAPLPIMVAAFGFGSIAGLIAALVGALAVALVDLRPAAFAALHMDKVATGGSLTWIFVCVVGLPSWLLTRLACVPPSLTPTNQVRPEEKTLGAVVAFAAGFAMIGTVLVLMLEHGVIQPFLATKAKELETMILARGPLPKGIDPGEVAFATVRTLTEAIMAAAGLMLLTFNLWLAARTARMSGLLPVPWPDVPRSLLLPRPLAIVLAVALGLCFAGGPLGMLGVIASGVLVMAFALQGLAVIHAVTRGKSFRLPLLIIVYLTLVMLMPWSVVFHGLLGLLDAGFAFRDRQKPIVKKKT